MEIGDSVKVVGILEDLFANIIWEIIHIWAGRTFYTITSEEFGTRCVQSDEIQFLQFVDYDLGI